MATFTQCLQGIDGLANLLTTRFNDVARSLYIAPVPQEDVREDISYRYMVGLDKALTDEEKKDFPETFNGAPVSAYIISDGFRDRMKDYQPVQ